MTSRRWFDPKPLRQQLVLRVDHVVVGVLRELRAQPVARLARLPVADPVGQHDVVPRRVEHLPGPEQLAAEGSAEKCAARPTGSVQHHHRVSDHAGVIANRLAECDVVQAQLRQRSPVSNLNSWRCSRSLRAPAQPRAGRDSRSGEIGESEGEAVERAIHVRISREGCERR